MNLGMTLCNKNHLWNIEVRKSLVFLKIKVLQGTKCGDKYRIILELERVVSVLSEKLLMVIASAFAHSV